MSCAERGHHVRKGMSASTDPDDILWEPWCAECGADLRGTENGYSVAEFRRAMVEGSHRIEWRKSPPDPSFSEQDEASS